MGLTGVVGLVGASGSVVVRAEEEVVPDFGYGCAFVVDSESVVLEFMVKDVNFWCLTVPNGI